uniref:G-protein coupled receptors family 1 profile domain-containing protein n=1 Tax=Biomphalaria glabrata TaxID=6526 RepID=A0A2C9L3Y8_BIOGL
GILLYPGFYTNNNLLLLSLAFADFLVGIYCLPMYLLSYIEVTRVVVYSTGGSLVSLLFIAIDRYVAVIWPLKYGGIITAERLITSLLLTGLNVEASYQECVIPSLTSIVQSQLMQSSSKKVTGIDSPGNKTLNPTNTQSRDTEIYRDCLPYDYASVIP